MQTNFTCRYELQPGETRLQALAEGRRRLQEQLHSHASLLHTLRCIDSETAFQVLARLRDGHYDGTLLGSGTRSQATHSAGRLYPWEVSPNDGRRSPGSHNIVLRPTDSVSDADTGSTDGAYCATLPTAHKLYPAYE